MLSATVSPLHNGVTGLELIVGNDAPVRTLKVNVSALDLPLELVVSRIADLLPVELNTTDGFFEVEVLGVAPPVKRHE
jgi:hypothetical protein